MNDNIYTLIYAAIVCFICSFLLAFFAMWLKPDQERAAQLDLNKKLLNVMGLYHEGMSNEEVDRVFKNQIREKVIDQTGKILSEYKSFNEVPEKEHCELLETGASSNPNDCKLSVFQRIDNSELVSMAIPIKGKGLWSTLYGFLALQPDANTVSGLTFYKHAETPGLGAEISKEWFQDNFVGKRILNSDGELYGVAVAKGKAKDSSHPEEHVVDGISGATITANGVTKLIKHCVKVYSPYLAQFRKEE